ncbi:hypothetical protein B5M09_010468 [Aphanomyces astaci]|uniref:Uncharacterized protein n=1 Tax=Aphanomyces astaci TaxID=112090 RepID=A0A3R7Y3V2_APHAT|nr:hypothetical protein B5M09_010468 [Aphanomyces astaci]
MYGRLRTPGTWGFGMRHTPQERHPLNRENNSNSPVEVQELDLTSDTNTNFAVFAELPVLEMPSEPDLDGFVFDLDCYLMVSIITYS